MTTQLRLEKFCLIHPSVTDYALQTGRGTAVEKEVRVVEKQILPVLGCARNQSLFSFALVSTKGDCGT